MDVPLEFISKIVGKLLKYLAEMKTFNIKYKVRIILVCYTLKTH